MLVKMYVWPIVKPYTNLFMFSGKNEQDCFLQCQGILNSFRAKDSEKHFHIYRCVLKYDNGIVVDIKGPNKNTNIFIKYDKLKELCPIEL